MRHYATEDLREASSNASSYKEFKDNLAEMGYRVPLSVNKFPMHMKGWKRKLRYEKSQDPHYGEPTTRHDIRQMEYYERLERLGHPDPLMIMPTYQ